MSYMYSFYKNICEFTSESGKALFMFKCIFLGKKKELFEFKRFVSTNYFKKNKKKYEMLRNLLSIYREIAPFQM